MSNQTGIVSMSVESDAAWNGYALIGCGGASVVSMTAPVANIPSLSSGGSLVSGTPYYWKVSAVNGLGETIASNEVTVTPSGANLTATVTWNSVAGAMSYKLFRTTTSGTYGASSLVSSGILTTSYIDTGAALSAGTLLSVATDGFITLAKDPINALHSATKQYVDAVATGLDVKLSVRAATTGALPAHTRSGNILTATANGAFPAQDGVTLVLNDSLLVKDEGGGTHLENGPYCLSSDTEILTTEGWKLPHDLRGDEIALTLNIKTGRSEWQPIKGVHIFPAAPREMLSLEGRRHSSISTLNHRWPVMSNGHVQIKQSKELRYFDQIIRSAKCDSLPAKAKYSDEEVELVAWFICEGHIRKWNSGRNGQSVRIVQSENKNPAYTRRIRRCLALLFGPSRSSPMRYLEKVAWRERPANARGIVCFDLNRHASSTLLMMAPDKVPTAEFIMTLTEHQLNVFLETCVDADGWRLKKSSTNYFVQKDTRRIDVIQFVAALAGVSTTSRRDRTCHTLSLSRRTRTVSPLAPRNLTMPSKCSASVSIETMEVWCPRTANGTWYARRKGTTFFTGNTLTQVGDGSNPWKLTRRTDADASIEVTSGMFMFITEGTLQKGEGWVLTTADPITLNTTALTFTQFTALGEVAAGNGMVKVLNTIHFAQSVAYTAGAIPFATSTSAMGFDASNLTWDNTNHWLVFGSERAIKMASVDQPFMMMVAHSTNFSIDNPTLSIGYNFTGLLSVSDARLNNTKPAFSIDMEARFTPDGAILQHEWNHNYRATDGSYFRGWAYIFNHGTFIGSWQWRGSNFGWTNETASTQLALLNTAGFIINGALSTNASRKLEVVDSSGIQARLTRDGTHYVDLGVDSAGGFTISPTGGFTRFVAGTLRCEGTTSPTTGKGLEIAYNTGTDTGSLIAFNRDTSAYKALNLDASTIGLNSGSGGKVGVATASPSCALDINGVIRAQGSTGASTGAGVEISYGSSVGGIIAFDRTGAAYKQLKLDGLSVAINSGSGGSVGIKLSTITALLHIAGGTTAASTAPLKFTSGSRMTTAEVGACEYNNDFYHTRNGGTVRFGLGGAIFDHFADAGNTTTTETDLYSDTLPASTFDANGVKVFADYGGTFVSSGTATRQIRVYFGGTVILDSGALSISASASWSIYVVLIRASSSEVRYFAALQTSSAALASYASSGAVTGLTLTNTQVLKITAQAAGVGAATNDCVAKLGQVSVLAPA